MTDPADKQTMMCGSILMKKRMRAPKSEHTHNWAQKFKNACAHWHSTDLRGRHDDPWTRLTCTALTAAGTEREASAHWLRESRSAAALRTNFPRSIGLFCLFVHFIGNPTGGMPNYRESRLQRSYSEHQKKKKLYKLNK